MMHWRSLPRAVVALALSAVPAMAGHIVPGLWEVRTEQTTQEPNMAKLPPALQAQMKAASIVTARLCVTPEQASREDFVLSRTSRCKVESLRTFGNRLTADVTCTRGKAAIRTHYQIVYETTKTYSGTITMTIDSNGTQKSRTAKMDAHFVADDCGSVKPIEVPKP